MKDRFRVCVLQPPGFVHSRCFAEVAELLARTMASLGRSCDVTWNRLARDRLNILLGYHLLPTDKWLRPFPYIPYQLEQLREQADHFDLVRRILEGAREVWDYSPENIAFLRERGIAARHLPVGHHPALDRIPDSGPRPLDVLFYGSLNDRRKTVLDRLQANPRLKLHILFGVYGKERDAFIAQAKILLNIHWFPTRIFEAVRISYLLNSRCFVLTETSDSNPYPGVDFCEAPLDDLEKMCEYYVAHEEERDRLRRQSGEQFRDRYPMTEWLRSVLE